MFALTALSLALSLSLPLPSPSLFAADDPKPKNDAPAQPSKADADLKLMQGKWIGDSPEGMETRWEVKDRTITVEIGDQTFVAKVELDAEAKPHSAVDFKLTKPEDAEGKTVLAIYKIEKDKLTICASMPDDAERPTVFQMSENKHHLYELKRPKK